MPCLFHCENLCNIGNPMIPSPHPHNQRMPQGEELNPTHQLYIVGAREVFTMGGDTTTSPYHAN